MKRIYNFSAGPSMLPEAVLQKAADELLNYQGYGLSVMDNYGRGTFVARSDANSGQLQGIVFAGWRVDAIFRRAVELIVG